MANFANFAKGSVPAVYDAAATMVTLAAGHGSRFPEAPFRATWWNVTDYADAADDPFREIVQCTSKSGDVLLVQRGQESTVASAKNITGKTYRMASALTAADAAGFMAISPTDATVRIKNGTHLQVFDSATGGYRTFWFENGAMVVGPSEA